MSRKAFRSALLTVAVALGAGVAAPATADVRAFATACSAPELAPDRTIRMCTLALQAQRLGAKGQAQVHVNRGVAFSALDLPEQALADFTAAADLFPELIEIWLNQGRTLLRLGRPADAFESFNTALRLDGDDRDALIGRAGALIAGGAPGRALADLDAAIESDENDALALYNRAIAYMALGQADRAAADLTGVLALTPRDVEAHLKRGELREGPYLDGALADYGAAIDLAPDDPRGYFQRGKLLDRLGLVSGADEDFRRAWELGMRDEWLHERIVSIGG